MYLFSSVLSALFLCSYCEDDTLKLDYLEKLVKSAVEQSKTYQIRKNNGDYLENVEENEALGE